MRQPYFVTRLQCWYVKDPEGRAVRLDPKKELAFEIWHAMKANSQESGPNISCRLLINKFLHSKHKTFSESRLKTVKYYMRLFASEHGNKKAIGLSESRVLEWVTSPKPIPKSRTRKLEKPSNPKSIVWGEWSQRQVISILKRIWKWGHSEGLISKNPVADLKLPEGDYRDDVVDLETHRKLVWHCRELEEARPFALFLIAMRCGARPQQVRLVQAKNVGADFKTWTFKKHKTAKKTKKPIVVYLSPCLQTLTKILAAARPCGSLFLNSDGQPWKSDTVTQRISRLRERLDLPKDFVIYLYRHTLATDALKEGLSGPVVAKLLGHVDTRMVSKVYGHLEKHPEHLLDAVNRVAAARIQSDR